MLLHCLPTAACRCVPTSSLLVDCPTSLLVIDCPHHRYVASSSLPFPVAAAPVGLVVVCPSVAAIRSGLLPVSAVSGQPSLLPGRVIRRFDADWYPAGSACRPLPFARAASPLPSSSRIARVPSPFSCWPRGRHVASRSSLRCLADRLSSVAGRCCGVSVVVVDRWSVVVVRRRSGVVAGGCFGGFQLVVSWYCLLVRRSSSVGRWWNGFVVGADRWCCSSSVLVPLLVRSSVLARRSVFLNSRRQLWSCWSSIGRRLVLVRSR